MRDSKLGLDESQIDKIAVELSELGTKHVTLGGNEPFFTNGPVKSNSKLAYIVRALHRSRVSTHLISSGPSVSLLSKHDNEAFRMLSSVNLSLDSPFQHEHDNNRGSKLFKELKAAAEITANHKIRLIFVYCAMNWNFDEARILAFLDLARKYGAHPRVNPAKPIIRNGQLSKLLDRNTYWKGFDVVTREWPTQVVTEPPLREALGLQTCTPRCGKSTFRINSTNKDGAITVSSCTYIHNRRFGDLRHDHLSDIVGDLESVECGDCLARRNVPELDSLNGDAGGIPDWSSRELVASDLNGGFEDYLCTWIGGRPAP